MVVQSVAVSIQNLLLAIHTEGLRAYRFCSSLFCHGTVRKVLGAPEGVGPQALMTVSYLGEKPESPARKPFESVVFETILGGRE